MKIHLSIGGFILTVKYRGKDKRYIEQLLNDIYSNYSNFIFLSQTVDTDCLITIRHVNTIALSTKKHPYSFILLYKKIEESIYETYSYISFSQFTVIVLRLITNLLNRHSGFILHASANIINNKGYLFLGRSGSGKSTITRLLSKKYPTIADDNLIVRPIANGYYVFQSPLIQKENMKKSVKRIHLGKIFFIKKDIICSAELIKKKSKVFKKMLEHLWVEKDTLSPSAHAVSKFTYTFNSFYKLNFPNDRNELENFFKDY